MDVEFIDDLTALADATRSRMLVLLERHELTVGELCAVLQLPQSTVSRHLKTLADAAWVSSRRDGTSRYYALAIDGRDEQGRRLWTLLRDQVRATRGADQDARRLKTVLKTRQTKSQQFFEAAAAEWDRLRQDLYGRSSHFQAVPALLDANWLVGDLGCGTGALSATLAPFVARVFAVDRSADMLEAARRRLREFPNVEVRKGDLEGLPIEDETLDAATLVLVLHHLPDPASAIGEAGRTLKPGGRLLITDMLPHDHEEYRQQMGHVWLGFGEEQIRRFCTGAGFRDVRVVALPPDREAKGPALFAASAVRA
jgi:ArsR family transcriptional regulator